MTELTVTITDDLARRLAPYGEEQLSQILERGLDQVETAQAVEFTDLRDVLDTLATLPEPSEVLALRPSARLQQRVAELLEKNRSSGLTVDEEREFAVYEFAEHLVRTAKARAQSRLNAS